MKLAFATFLVVSLVLSSFLLETANAGSSKPVQLRPLPGGLWTLEQVEDIAKLALDKYNEDNNLQKKYQFVKFLKANYTSSIRALEYYITFEAKDVDDQRRRKSGTWVDLCCSLVDLDVGVTTAIVGLTTATETTLVFERSRTATTIEWLETIATEEGPT
ncbi:hypothetical protein RHGRI_016322 [Rhododendron griersonianum]|uniref:Cystatin domain-containing protein n=1 Tax=Rhododendron griersonianum TaxID=479676 RepID=A0AAV6JTT8_9ERIC|nr:hypothetical protein RHGRI_016322 [Rhododendron griersonianum]